MKEKIINNNFINILRSNIEIDEDEYLSLCNELIYLEKKWKNVKCIDKELAFYLYLIPNIVRNIFLNSKDTLKDDAFLERLEDILIELDQLITNCFC